MATSTSLCMPPAHPSPLHLAPSTPAPPQVSPDRVLTISGERKEEMREGSEEGGNLRVERSFGSFMRRFRLPDNVDVEGGWGWGAVAAGTG